MLREGSGRRRRRVRGRGGRGGSEAGEGAVVTASANIRR